VFSAEGRTGRLSFLAWKFDAPLAIVIFLVLLSGVVIGVVASFGTDRSRKKQRNVARGTGDAPSP
jgi:uncharacterized integral membrane protein